MEISRLEVSEVEETMEDLPLFSLSRVRKPEYWQFIKLVAPSKSLPEGKKDWTSEDAVGIYCLKCKKQLKFSKGSSGHIRNHMRSKHPTELNNYLQQQQSTASWTLQASSYPRQEEKEADIFSPWNLPTDLPLFDQRNVRKPEYWQFIKLIAPAKDLPPHQRRWRSADAVGLYCLKCRKRLCFQKGSSGAIRSHMTLKHSEDVQAFKAKENNSKIRSARALVTTGRKRKQDEISVHKSNSTVENTSCTPEFARYLLTKWIVKGYHSISVLEEEAFVEFCGLLHFQVPDSAQMQEFIRQTNEESMLQLRNILAMEMTDEVWYSCSTDIWISPTVASLGYLALHLHYLTQTFEYRDFVLGVVKLTLPFDPIVITEEIRKILDEFGLHPSQMSILIKHTLIKHLQLDQFPQLTCCIGMLKSLAQFILPQSQPNQYPQLKEAIERACSIAQRFDDQRINLRTPDDYVRMLRKFMERQLLYKQNTDQLANENTQFPSATQLCLIHGVLLLHEEFTKALTGLASESKGPVTLPLALSILLELKETLRSSDLFRNDQAFSTAYFHTSDCSSSIEILETMKQTLVEMLEAALGTATPDHLWITAFDIHRLQLRSGDKGSIPFLYQHFTQLSLPKAEQDRASGTCELQNAIVSSDLDGASDSRGYSVEPELNDFVSESHSSARSTTCFSWWETRRVQFPLLSKLSRKWLGAVASAHELSGALSKRRESLHDDLVRDITMLHQNIEFYAAGLQQ